MSIGDLNLNSYYDVGDVVRLRAVFRVDGVGTNPTSVTLKILDPDSVTTTPTPTSEGSGSYYYDLSITKSGIWRYRWEGTGAAQAAEEGTFVVRTKQVT